MIEIIGIALGLLGIPALILSYISYRNGMDIDKKFEGKFKSFEEKFEEKERIKELTKKISDLCQNLRLAYVDDIKNPLSNQDLDYSLNNLWQDILSQSFDKKKDTTIVELNVHMFGNIHNAGPEMDENKSQDKFISLDIESVDEFITQLDRIQNPHFSIYAFTESDLNVHYEIFSVWSLFHDIDLLAEEYGNYINDFCPNLLGTLKECLKNVLVTMIESATRNKIELTPKNFNHTIDLALHIHREVVASQKVESYVVELEELIDKLEKVRLELLTTAYA